MGEKISKPWGFGFVGGRKGTGTYKLFFFILLFVVVVRGGGFIYTGFANAKQDPQIAFKSLLIDIKEFKKLKGRMPANYFELESLVWAKDNPKYKTQLINGDIQKYIIDNYEYVFFEGSVDGKQIVNIWANPLGEKRSQFPGYLIVIVNDTYKLWKSEAFDRETRSEIIESGFNPTFEMISRFNMAEVKKEKSEGGKSFNPFKYF